MKRLKEYMDRFFKNDKSSKELLNVIISMIVILSICLFSYSVLFDKKTDEKVVVDEESKKMDESLKIYEEDESKLEGILGEIAGVGEVHVMVTYETSTEHVPAVNIKEGNDQRQEDVVMSGNNSQPVIVKEIKPKIKGVIIVAEGATDVVIKSNIVNATAAVFDISTSRVSVFAKKKQ